MPPKSVPFGSSPLSKILDKLKNSPRLDSRDLRSLKLTLAAKNDHFGARRFIKEQLPRIRYADPDLVIDVTKIPKSASDVWKPEMVLEFRNGKRQTLDLHSKWSTTILKEAMDIVGSA